MRFGLTISGLILVLPGFAQTTVPRLKDGHPDLNGFWNNANLTPFQRPAGLGEKQYFTSDEARAFEKTRLEEVDRDRRNGKSQADLDGAYNEVWFDRGTKIAKSGRTSLIIDPPDGRVPPLTATAKTKFEKINAELALHPADNPEDLPLPVRCLMFSQVGPPMLPGNYNDNYEIVQTPENVSILAEMGNITRVIPVGGKPHLPSTMRQWTGDSKGHWEGNTLVVDTTGFRYTNRSRFGVVFGGPSDENLHVTERFTRTDADTLLYRATVEDETVYTKPWTIEVPMKKIEGPIFEYACHEGNYGMTGILGGARAEEKKLAVGADRER
jgi:hypothetical protein